MTTDYPKHDFKFEVLQEQVATEDLFEEKTHERVASTLDELIRSTKQGLTIGLEGGWGSGKSTVINLLKEKLSGENDKTLFFVFDAWAHDGDPLRKIFLESLITSINPKKNDKKLNDLKEKVSARTKTVNVRTEKSASRLGKTISWTALLIPVGAALLSAVDYNSLLMPWHNQASTANLAFLFGILFSFSPLAVLTWWAKWGDRDSETNKVKWDIFQSDSTENYTQDITEDGERTSIEFEKFFKDILCYVFESSSQYKYERAIIVVDNLDRVEAEYAQNVWSTLQTFFQHRTSSLNGFDEKWNQQLWFLIPHDREGIQRIWHNPNTGDESVNQEISSSFMEKCFQVNVEVPPPVMSTWIEYFKQCVQKSLTGWSDNYKDEYINSYIQCMSRLDTSPSPRQIHTLINRAGVLALQWKDEFSAEAYCLYSLCRKSMTESEFRQKLLIDGVPSSYPTIRSANKVKAELAGLLFGVKADKGMQLLLSPEIRDCMNERDGEKLKALSIIHKEAFWLVLRASRENWLPTASHTDDYKLDVIEVLYTAFHTETNLVQKHILSIEDSMSVSIDKWKFDEFTFSEGVDKLIKLSENKPKLLTQLEQGIRARIVSCAKSDDFKVKELYQLKEMEELLENHNKPIEKKNYPFLEVTKWQAWLEACSKQNIQFNSILPKKDVFKNLINGAQFDQPTLNISVFNALRNTYKIHPINKAWPKLIESITTWLNIPNRDFECEEVYAFVLEIMRNSTDEEKDELKGTIRGANFWQAAVNSELDTNPSLKLLAIIADPNFRKNQHINNRFGKYYSSPWSAEELNTLFIGLKNANELYVIWELAADHENEFAREIIRTHDDHMLFENGASKVDEIPWANEEETSSVIQKLVANKAFDSILESVSEDPCLYGGVLLLFGKYGNKDVKAKVQAVLKNASRKDWIQALEEQNDILDFIPANTSNFAKAWTDHLALIISGATTEPKEDNLSKIIALKRHVVDLDDVYLPSLTEKYFAEKDIISDVAFDLLSALFAKSLSSIKQKDIELRLSDWIEFDKLARVKWLVNTKYQFNEKISQTLEADVSTKLKGANNEDHVFFKVLSTRLGVISSSTENISSDD